MRNAFTIISENIETWWYFMWATDVPGTNFKFAHLYIFILMFSIFTGVISIMLGRSDQNK